MAADPAAQRTCPVLLDRCRRAARARPAAPAGRRASSTRRSGMGGHAEALLAAVPARPAASGSTATRRRSRWPDAARAVRPTALTLVHAVYDELPRRAGRPRAAARSRACCSTSASRRCSSTRPTAASPTRRTRRSTCGWTTTGGMTAADVLNTYPVEELARILREYGEERFARRIAERVVREREREPVDDLAPGWSSSCAPVDPGRDPAHRRQPGQAHVPGAAHRGERRARGAGARAARRDRRARRRRPDRRDGLPLARGPHGQAGARRRRATQRTAVDLPVGCPSTRPRTCGC